VGVTGFDGKIGFEEEQKEWFDESNAWTADLVARPEEGFREGEVGDNKGKDSDKDVETAFDLVLVFGQIDCFQGWETA